MVPFTSDRKQQFLDLFRSHPDLKGCRGLCAEAVGVSITTVYDHLKRDPEFAEAFEDALQAEPPAVDEVEVRRTGEGHLIEETYHLDQHGIVSVSITDLDTGYRQSHQLGLAGSARL